MSTSGATSALSSIRDLMSQLKGCASDFESFMAQQLNHLDTLQEHLNSQSRLMSQVSESQDLQAAESARRAELESEIARLRGELQKAESVGQVAQEQSQQNVQDLTAERDSLRGKFEAEKKQVKHLQRQFADEREEWKAELKLLRRALEARQQNGEVTGRTTRPAPASRTTTVQKTEEPPQRPSRPVTLTMDEDRSDSNPALDQVMQQFKQLQATFVDDDSET